MLIKETWVNESKGYICGDTGLYEPYTEDIKRLFKSCQKEYGRCVSKMYIDPDKQIGWVFEKRQYYEDTHEPYTQSTWVELHDNPPDVTTKNHYHVLS